MGIRFHPDAAGLALAAGLTWHNQYSWGLQTQQWSGNMVCFMPRRHKLLGGKHCVAELHHILLCFIYAFAYLHMDSGERRSCQSAWKKLQKWLYLSCWSCNFFTTQTLLSQHRFAIRKCNSGPKFRLIIMQCSNLCACNPKTCSTDLGFKI
jgi:hypothetical protein